MVFIVTHYFHDIIDVSATTSLQLPAFKENGLKIEYHEHDNDTETIYQGQKPVLPFANSEVYNAHISDWRRLTAVDEGCKPVYEVTFDVKGSHFKFKPGDTIGILPHNKTSEVDFIISHLGLKADLVYTLSAEKSVKGKIPPYVPVKSTLRHVLTHCLDLRGVLKKLFLLALSRYTKLENERKILEYLCSKEGSNIYTSHILNKGLCILDIFSIFKSCTPPIEALLEYLPRLLPRPYSIVNSHLKDPNVIKICFSVMKLGNGRKGLTTGWLEEIVNTELEDKMEKLSISGSHRDSKVPIYLRKNLSNFCMPEDLSTPLILIGPGTGISPYIGFLEERLIKSNGAKQLGKVWLFFGCRNPNLDFIYEKELTNFKENGVLDKLIAAFSRVDGEVKYVQDALLQNGEEVVKMIKDGASIFICGDLKTLATQIREVLLKCLVKYDQKTLEEAEMLLTDLQKNKRYFVDAWN